MKIDTENWGEFEIKSLFVTEQLSNGKIQVPTGAYVSKKELNEKGGTPRITVTGTNNGIFGYFCYIGHKDGEYRFFKNFISVSFLGTVFYQKSEASIDMKVHCLLPLNIILNEYIGEYLVSVIRATIKKSSYADQISSTVLPFLKIKLPIDKNGNPDWLYMENYMKGIEAKVKSALQKLKQAKVGKSKLVDVSAFKRFHLYDDDLFDIDAGTKMDKVKMKHNNPSVAFVGRSNANSGVTDFVDVVDGVKPYLAGTLTVSLGGEYLGSCFIQEKPYYTSQNVNVLIPKWNMPILCKRYIAEMIFKEGRTYYKAFIDELNRHIKTDFSILLPVDKQGNPDWKYMEDYMRQVEKRVQNNLQYLRSAV